MKNKQLFLFILLFGLNPAVFSQVTFYQFDPDKVNAALTKQMDSLYQEDQKCRIGLARLMKKEVPKESLDSMKRIIKEKDSSNLVFITKLIDNQGWLTPQDIGFQGVQTLFLIIQHADLQTQKKYYPLILKAEKEGNMLSSNVALLEDRIAVREGRPQTYGSQGYYDSSKKKTFIYPLVDAQNLDQLRKSRGLGPMHEYKKDWDIIDYESYLPYSQQLLRKAKEENDN